MPVLFEMLNFWKAFTKSSLVTYFSFLEASPCLIKRITAQSKYLNWSSATETFKKFRKSFREVHFFTNRMKTKPRTGRREQTRIRHFFIPKWCNIGKMSQLYVSSRELNSFYIKVHWFHFYTRTGHHTIATHCPNQC